MEQIVLYDEFAKIDEIAAAIIDALPAACARDLTPRWADPGHTVVRADCGRHTHTARLAEVPRPGHAGDTMYAWVLEPAAA